jgi:hypothetical protein
MDEQAFGIPATTQVKPSDDEVVLLKANGYVAHDWVYDVKQAPVFLDGAWNRERRSLGLSPSMSVAYPRTSTSRNSYRNEQNSYRNDQNPYRNDNNSYRNDNTYRNDRRPRSPRRDTYDQRSRSRSRGRGRDHQRSRRSRSRSSYRSPSRGHGRDHRRSRRSRSRSRGRDYRDRSPARDDVMNQLFQDIISGRVAIVRQPSPPRSPARHNHMNRRAPPAPSSLTQNQQAHSALPRSGRFDTPRTVNQRARPAPSRRTDLGVSDPMDWQPHTQSLGSDLNTQNRQERPELSKLTNFNIPGTEGQEPPAPSQSTAANVPNVVDSSAKNDEDKFDIDLEYR